MSGHSHGNGISLARAALVLMVVAFLSVQMMAPFVSAKPTIEIPSPDPGEVVKGKYLIEARISGDPEEVRLYLDNMWLSNMKRVGTTTSHQYTLDTWAFPDGPHNIRVWAKDATGSDSLGYSFYIDNIGPQISNISFVYPGGQQAAKKGDKVIIMARISDSSSGISVVKCDASRMGGSKDVVMFDDGFHNDTSAGDGIYGSEPVIVGTPTNGWTLMNVTATDKAGNIRKTVAFVALDNHPPDLEEPIVVYPKGQTAAKMGDQVRIVVNTSDIGSGGTIRMPTDVVLVLDNSGSMSGRPMEDMTVAVKAFINQSQPDDRIAVYAFGDDGTMNYETSKRYIDFTKMDQAGKDDINYLLDQDWVFNRGYNTPIWDTIGEAIGYALASHENTPCVVALTDGTDYGYDWFDKPDPTWWQDWYYSGLGFERGSEAYAPWNSWDTNIHYTAHYGEYFMYGQTETHSFNVPIEDLDGYADYPEGWDDRDFDDGVRRGLLQAPIPVYTIGMNISHYEPMKANTTEYDLANIGLTSKSEEAAGKYFYAPTSSDLESIYKAISYYINLGGDLNITPPGGIKKFTISAMELGIPVAKPLYDDGTHDDIYGKDEVFGTDMLTVNTGVTQEVSLPIDATDIATNTGQVSAEVEVDNILPVVTNVRGHYPTHTSSAFEYVKDGEKVWIEADVSDTGEVHGITKVELDARALGGSGNITMADDGMGKDAKAGDGTYTTVGDIVIASGAHNGNLKVTARAYDRALNMGSADGSILVRNLETVVLNITDPKDDQYIEGIYNFKVFANAPEVIAEVQMMVLPGVTGAGDETHASFMSYNSGTGDFRSDMDTHVLADGTYIMNASAKDILEGEYWAAPIRFNVDNTPPTVEVVVPKNGEIVNGEKDVDVNVGDVFPCILRYVVDNGTWTDADPGTTQNQFDWKWSTIGLRDGFHTMTLEATDPIGHMTSTTFQVLVDNTPPKIIPVDVPFNGQNVSGKVHISFNVEESVGLEEVYLFFDKGERRPVPFNPVTGLYELDINSTELGNGAHTVTIGAVDQAGFEDSTQRAFVIQNVEEPPPDPTLTETVKSLPIYFWAIVIILTAALVLVAIVYVRERYLHRGTEKMLRSMMDRRKASEVERGTVDDAGMEGTSAEAVYGPGQEAGTGARRMRSGTADRTPPKAQGRSPAEARPTAGGGRTRTGGGPRGGGGGVKVGRSGTGVARKRVPLEELLQEETPVASGAGTTVHVDGREPPHAHPHTGFVKCPVCHGRIQVTTNERPLVITCTKCGSMGRLGG